MQCMYLAMYGNEVSIGSAIFISIFAMIIVFVVLLLISFMIDITAAILNIGKKGNDKQVQNVSNKSESSKTDTTVDIAVIAAAVAAYLGTSVDNIKIKKIRRGNANMSLWRR